MGFWLGSRWVPDSALSWYYAQRKCDRIDRILRRISKRRPLQYDEAKVIFENWMDRHHRSNLGYASIENSVLRGCSGGTLIDGKWKGLSLCGWWRYYADEATAERREWYYLNKDEGFVRWETEYRKRKKIDAMRNDVQECKKMVNKLRKELRNVNHDDRKAQEASL